MFVFLYAERRSAQCPPPLIHTDCDAGEKGLECARTCRNLDLPCVSLACIPGCLCPPGTVGGVLFLCVLVCVLMMYQTFKWSIMIDWWIDFRYVTSETALHRNSVPVTITTGRMHQGRPSLWIATLGKMTVCTLGYVGVNLHCARLTCSLVYSVCENRKWRCTEKVCDGVCRTVGERHFISFDGFKYSFPGLCQYVLVQVRDRAIQKELQGGLRSSGIKTDAFISSLYPLPHLSFST